VAEMSVADDPAGLGNDDRGIRGWGRRHGGDCMS